MAGKAPTCTETGLTRDCYYRSDGLYFEDAECTQPLSKNVVIYVEYGNATLSDTLKIYRSITVDDGITLGSVTSNKSTALPGDTVTLTVDFGGNNDLTSITVTGASGSVSLNKTGNTTYTFVMPGEDVTVDAQFAEALQLGDVNEDGEVNISDVTELLNFLAVNNSSVPLFDLNGDGSVNISDVTKLLDILSGN